MNQKQTEPTFFKVPDDCTSHGLVKVETEAGSEVSDKEWYSKQKDARGEKTAADDGSKNASAGANGDCHITAAKSQGLSDYELKKVKNVAKLKRQLAELDKKYPLPEELRQKEEYRKPGISKKGKAPQGDVVRRASTRIKDQRM